MFAYNMTNFIARSNIAFNYDWNILISLAMSSPNVERVIVPVTRLINSINNPYMS